LASRPAFEIGPDRGRFDAAIAFDGERISGLRNCDAGGRNCRQPSTDKKAAEDGCG
jgi:hypothetical protein